MTHNAINTLRTIAIGTASTLAILGSLNTAQAADTSPWSFRVGATKITPHIQSGDLSSPSFSGTQADILSNTQISGGVNYKLSEQWSVDVPLAPPFKHDVVGAGAIAGTGKLGTVKALPFTVLMQYQIDTGAKAMFKPYVGAGLTYAKFFGEQGTGTLTGLTGGTAANPTTFRIESRLAPSIQLGAKLQLNEVWHLDASYIKTYFSTRNKLSTGQTLDAVVNPSTVSIGLGYAF